MPCGSLPGPDRGELEDPHRRAAGPFARAAAHDCPPRGRVIIPSSAPRARRASRCAPTVFHGRRWLEQRREVVEHQQTGARAPGRQTISPSFTPDQSGALRRPEAARTGVCKPWATGVLGRKLTPRSRGDPAEHHKECCDPHDLSRAPPTVWRFRITDSDRDGDHDRPYRLGWRSRANVLYVFNTRQYARLLVFRSRLQDHLAGKDQAGDTSSLASAA